MQEATGITPGSPATDSSSSSHLWHQALQSPQSPQHRSGSRLFSFVSLSACCLPCLITRPTTSTLTSTSTSPSPRIQPIPFPLPSRPQSEASSRRKSRSVSEPRKAKTPSRPSSLLTTKLKSDNEEEAFSITPASSSSSSTSSTSSALPSTPIPETPITMADRTLKQILNRLRSNPELPYPDASALLSQAKIALLQLNAATPGTSDTSAPHLGLARDIYEQGALISIRARNPDAFTRYVSQLQPFYELPSSSLPSSANVNAEEQRNKVTGLYLLLLLTQGRYAEFHSELETLGTRAKQGGGASEIEGDRFLGYPIKLERWLMEGSYDRVWKAMKSREVPSEEYGAFSEILTSQIRSEIASSSERAYPSLPLSSTKSLLFLDSEGAVVDFARHRGWTVRDGHIYFPTSAATADGEEVLVGGEEEGDEKDFSRMIIENTLGYARELETIV
ncbi:SAC3/GANP/Nin1/mts3/eIF-3 p25 family-domain-containing protein [Hypoxylon crocopeplum]|nr:SAC3/GANP/Nin1/mts3/eIF-3 p25 family-domain-containing protein [Hypoxylon crocopeplum]